MKRLESKWALITGGGGEMAGVIARTLAAEGANILLVISTGRRRRWPPPI